MGTIIGAKVEAAIIEIATDKPQVGRVEIRKVNSHAIRVRIDPIASRTRKVVDRTPISNRAKAGATIATIEIRIATIEIRIATTEIRIATRLPPPKQGRQIHQLLRSLLLRR